MFIFDAPYISDIALTYLVQSQQPTFLTEFSSTVMPDGVNCLSCDEAIEQIAKNNNSWLYTNSENSIGTIKNLLGEGSPIIKKVEFFKNKFHFRKATEKYFPDIYFKEIGKDQIGSLSFAEIGRPVIIKPTVGFLSAGVYRVDNAKEWAETKKEILEKTETASATFSKDVIDSSTFLIESVIEGTEYAIDAYFDDNNEPVILNILEHRFSGEHDMSDRLYVTSADIIEKNMTHVEHFLQQLALLEDLCGFPLHAEVRIDDRGVVRPIEVNPLRFAGWCSTDIAFYAFGINVYEYFIEKKRPAWNEILKTKQGHEFAIAILEKSHPVPDDYIFDYERLEASLTSLITIRPIDYRKQPLFAFLFLDVDAGNASELHSLLTLDPQQFLRSF